MTERQRSGAAWAGTAFAFFFPTLLTFVYFVAAKEDPSLQKSCYAVGKAIQFLFPALFAAFVLRESIRPRSLAARGLEIGAVFGIAILIVSVYCWKRFSLEGGPLFAASEALSANLTPRLEGVGIRTLGTYILLALFYSVIHSGLEEYYWRWFVFGQMNKRIKTYLAAFIASVGFSLHHVLVVGDYFGYASPLTWGATLAVFCGGFFWCWLYDRSESIYAPWLSHGLIDAAIFLIGYRVLFS